MNISKEFIETTPSTKLCLSGAQLLIKRLERQGVTHISGISGGANFPMYDALTDAPI